MTVDENGFCKEGDSLEIDASKNLESQTLVNFKSQYSDVVSSISFSQLGDLTGFHYSSRISFFHEYDLRGCTYWGLSKRVCRRTSYDMGISEQLSNGHINGNISVRYIGSQDGVDMGYGIFCDSYLDSGSFLGEYTGNYHYS